jgi:hypothetical protein
MEGVVFSQSDSTNPSVQFTSCHFPCLGDPSCVDLGLRQAEIQGTNTSLIGVSMSKAFYGQSDATRKVAADYLSSSY